MNPRSSDQSWSTDDRNGSTYIVHKAKFQKRNRPGIKTCFLSATFSQGADPLEAKMSIWTPWENGSQLSWLLSLQGMKIYYVDIISGRWSLISSKFTWFWSLVSLLFHRNLLCNRNWALEMGCQIAREEMNRFIPGHTKKTYKQTKIPMTMQCPRMAAWAGYKTTDKSNVQTWSKKRRISLGQMMYTIKTLEMLWRWKIHP